MSDSDRLTRVVELGVITVEPGVITEEGDNLTTITFLRDRRTTSQCQECKHHHGKTYNGVELVCAMHPYGFNGKCPDWERRSTAGI